MLKGDELVQKRRFSSATYYKQGAIASNSAIDADDLQKLFRLMVKILSHFTKIYPMRD